ncbi:MAG: alginate export family protein [Bacteroidota bacterium]
MPIFLLLFLFYSPLQAQFELDGEFRPRGQFNNGFRRLPRPGEESALVFSQRIRINGTYQHKDQLKLYFSLQDARVFGDQDDRRDQANTGFFQAWAELSINKKLSFQLGRQPLHYDDGYLFTNPQWKLDGRTYDAGRLKFQDSTFQAHIVAAHNQDRVVLSETRFQNEIYKNLQIVWLKKTFGESRASFIFTNRGLQRADSVVRYDQTFGPNIKLQKGNKFIQGIYYFQTGRDTLDRERNANLLAIKLGYSPTNKLSFILGLDALSGTDGRTLASPNNRINNNFDNLYGYRHKYFGIIDYFYRGFFPPSGLRDFLFYTTYKFSNRLTGKMQLHSFHGHSDVLDPENPNNTLDDRLGFEADFLADYKLNDITVIKFGYAHLWATETMEAIQGGGNSDETLNFAYVELIIKPKFFSSND